MTNRSIHEPQSVILITIDTLRADRLSSYGYSRDTSPRIEALAAQGMVFEQVFAQRGLTWPSLTSIMTSRYPSDHGVRDNGEWLAKSKITLAEILRDADFDTAAFLTNMTNAPHRGFEHLEVFPVDSELASRDRPTDMLATEAAMRWLEQVGERRMFLWLHLLGPHAPYSPPSEFAARFAQVDPSFDGEMETLWEIMSGDREPRPGEIEAIRALYDAEVAFVDQLVGKVLDRVEQLGLADTTLIVFSADHGEELFDRQRYFFHQCSIYDSVLRLPLILRFPQAIEPGLRSDAIVQSVDIAPTIVELLGLAASEFRGRSLVPLLEQQPAAAEDVEALAFSELGVDIFSIRTSEWRLITNPNDTRIRAGGRGSTSRCYRIGETELYDLRADASERRNVADEYPEVVAGLRNQLLRWLQATPQETRRQETIPEETLEELRALGYLQ
ncbi:MAG: sulfatase [Acidobacteriota bacterium]